MKKLFVFFLIVVFAQFCHAETIQGGIEKRGAKYQNKIVDMNTQKPIPFALVKIPSQNFETYTDENGFFKLQADITGTAILSVEKSGYKPFSITISKENTSAPLLIGIEKTQISDLSIEADVIHLGDNSFSPHSANSTEFRLKSLGPYYSKKVRFSNYDKNQNAYLVIGSIIGIDTLMAHNLGQSGVVSTYSNPPQIYFNGHKIAEIKLNGDGQQILLPKQLIKYDTENEITIKTGRNLFQTDYVDYDDIELANIYIKYEPTIANND